MFSLLYFFVYSFFMQGPRKHISFSEARWANASIVQIVTNQASLKPKSPPRQARNSRGPDARIRIVGSSSCSDSETGTYYCWHLYIFSVMVLSMFLILIKTDSPKFGHVPLLLINFRVARSVIFHTKPDRGKIRLRM